jgi:hypothetical protein
VEHRLPEAFLEAPKLRAKCGLRDIEPLGRPRQAAFIGDGAEISEMVVVQERHGDASTKPNDSVQNIYWNETSAAP